MCVIKKPPADSDSHLSLPLSPLLDKVPNTSNLRGEVCFCSYFMSSIPGVGSSMEGRHMEDPEWRKAAYLMGGRKQSPGSEPNASGSSPTDPSLTHDPVTFQASAAILELNHDPTEVLRLVDMAFI